VDTYNSYIISSNIISSRDIVKLRTPILGFALSPICQNRPVVDGGATHVKQAVLEMEMLRVCSILGHIVFISPISAPHCCLFTSFFGRNAFRPN
jgi:hypothetical protein